MLSERAAVNEALTQARYGRKAIDCPISRQLCYASTITAIGVEGVMAYHSCWTLSRDGNAEAGPLVVFAVVAVVIVVVVVVIVVVVVVVVVVVMNVWCEVRGGAAQCPR